MTPAPEDATPAEKPPTTWALSRQLDKFERKLDKIQWDLDVLLSARETHIEEKKDERFSEMERDYKTIKKLAWAMLVGFLVAVTTAVASRWVRVVAAPAPVSSAERSAVDRVSPPARPTP